MISGDGDTPTEAAAFTAEGAGTVLREACRTAGLDPSGAELLRLGSNAVYRLHTAPVIVRIARDRDGLAEMDRAVRVARWLAEQDFPATRVLPGVEQPLTVGGRVVTFWESAQESEEYASLNELADLLRRLHWLEEPHSLGLPYFEPFPKLRASLAELNGTIPADDWTFLDERAGRLHKDYDKLDFVLPFGAIHGDANVGNVLRDHTGQAILIDLDGFSLAHREWDLILTAIYYDRYGWHSRTQYEGFVHHYGFDIMNWPGYPVLADLRELMMTLWMGQQSLTNPKAAEEFTRRVKAIKAGGGRKDWRPF
ncbi:phosphotransferase enzyme family protein [Actinacidiphila oryziradicis]|uniref:Aminoglycoside phosphotransferase family protein n=1 Tax=Actinacidiphila oryziradicis TaxID=2571141 RepID=A0A4U0SB02_9ACTN|nr:aminoglycoside phosphotransferase family protein [Actinacidiphila oryziradicis]TKA04551.1 aminoglycoside phosphotransferase family protein [Actinacidiphila oryziradicis]